MMKAEDTLTGKDIKEIPVLLEEFSRRAGSLEKTAVRSRDKVVYLVGRGSSGNATLFAKYVWEEFAGTITNFIHPHSIFEARKPLNFKGQAVWAFSQSGKSPDIVACLKKVIGWGARGAAVTNEADLAQNPLAKLAGRHILLSGSPELPVAATKSFILQLWAVLWTAQVWSGCFKKKDFTDTVELARKLAAEPFSGVGAGLIGKLKKAQMIGFVGRGTYNAIAEDSGLKFREMAKAHAMGYSAAEFLHGPVGAYTKKDFVFLLSPAKELPEDLVKVRSALEARGTQFEVLTPRGGKFPFNCLLADMEIKMIALNLAISKGLDPDRPKGLKKVTPTH